MPFKATNSKYYKVEIHLPAYGKTPRLSTRSTRKSTAKDMERALKKFAEDGYYDLIEALEPESTGKNGRIDLPTLFRAWRENSLDKLERRLNAPPLSEGVRDFAETLSYDNHRRGARHLLRLTVQPSGPRLADEDPDVTWLYEPENIDACVRHMVDIEDYAPNTVRNTVWGFLSKFLQARLPAGRSRSILDEADRPSEDDRRRVSLSPRALRRVISASEWELRMFLLIAASTGIDKSPILRIRGRDIDWKNWTLLVRDDKTKERRATIDLPPVAMYALHVLLEARNPEERAFCLSKGQIDYRWQKARERAGLTPENGYERGVRLKDLRQTFGAHYVQAGGDLAGLMGRLRHSREEQTLQYALYNTSGIEDMEDAARKMGLRLPDRLRDNLEKPDPESTSNLEIPPWWFNPLEPPRLIRDGEVKILEPTVRRTNDKYHKRLSPDDVQSALREAGTVEGAARLLGIKESTLRGMVKRYRLAVPRRDEKGPGRSLSDG